MGNNKTELVDDIITFFQKLGASNELSNRNFDTGEFFFHWNIAITSLI